MVSRPVIDVEHECGYRHAQTGEWIPPIWMLWLPIGWAWVGGGHTLACFSAKEARDARTKGEIEPCSNPECDICHEGDE